MTGQGSGARGGMAVVKIGGSLAREGRAADALAEVARADDGTRPAGGRRVLVMSGGGAEVDRVREAARRGELEGPEAYWTAVRALDRMAAALVASYEASHGPGRPRLCADLGCCREAWEEGELPVLTPFPVIRPVAGFPVAWEMTSDSIAAWMAYRVEADELLLAKARPPRSTLSPGPDGAPSAPAAALAEESLVDGFLPRFLARPEFPAACWIVDGSRAGRIAAWLGGEREEAVRVTG